MKSKLILLTLLVFTSNVMFGQSKKELRATVLRLQIDSTSLEKKLHEYSETITNQNIEILDLTKQINEQALNLTLATKLKDSLSKSVIHLNHSIENFHLKLDSINKYYKINDFVRAFYNSLETSDEENLRQYEYGDFKFDLENFNALVSKNARYNEGRVKNLTHEKNHDKYFIMLQSIEEIKFSLNKILVTTKVMYSGDNMGLFYNEEQLTLRDNKGVLKLTDWVDIDLYKMMPSMEATVENFTREDFYNWLDGSNK